MSLSFLCLFGEKDKDRERHRNPSVYSLLVSSMVLPLSLSLCLAALVSFILAARHRDKDTLNLPLLSTCKIKRNKTSREGG